MSIKIALAGNPNSGKTTLFNALTGLNQTVGNWPGVTIEKKEGKLKCLDNTTVVDLPGIYSLSPYSQEEVITRDFLTDDATRPDAIINIVDGSALERSLYLTSQLLDLGIPVVMAVNFMDVVERNGDKIDFAQLSQQLNCEVIGVTAIKSEHIEEMAALAFTAATEPRPLPKYNFSAAIEHTLAHIEEAILHNLPDEQQRYYAIKLFERDEKISNKLKISPKQLEHIEQDILPLETEYGETSDNIITIERYNYIDTITNTCCKVKSAKHSNLSVKIDKIVTNRILALPIFALVMFLVYYISVTTVGTLVTDFTNDGIFGEGFYIGVGAEEYEAAVEEYSVALEESAPEEAEDNAKASTSDESAPDVEASTGDDSGADVGANIVRLEGEADETGEIGQAEPNPADYGLWIPGIPVAVQEFLESNEVAPWLISLIVDGIIAGVGAVLGFVPQMFVLFFFLAILEGCGYIARIAFILDKLFRRFGLSGKSFIPILIGTGCGVPGIMASRTIENQNDRRMTIMTTTFIPCSAKLPIIALVAGALFGGAAWVAPSAYFIGIAAILGSGVILKKTKLFAGDVSPFIMELPQYHLPGASSVLHSMWERGWSFIKRAGTIILLASIVIWALASLGWAEDGSFGLVENMEGSILEIVGNAIAWLFYPLGWGFWQATVAAVTGLVAKENLVGTLGILYGMGEVSESGTELYSIIATNWSGLVAYSFMIFNLLCAPCFAAIGAIARELNNRKWFWFAIGYQCLLAYGTAFMFYQLIGLALGQVEVTGWTFAAAALAVFLLYMLFRRNKWQRRVEV